MPIPGGWASALGAAIQGGTDSYRQQQLDAQKAAEVASQLQSQKLQQQMLMQELAANPQRQAEAASRQQTNDANLKLLQDKVNELNQVHAEGDVKRYTDQFGDDRFNNPGFIQASKAAGINIPTQNVQQARVQGIESGAGAPVPTTQQQAAAMGVAPDTGAQLPAAVLLSQKEQERKGAMDDLTVKAMRDAFGGTPATGGTPAGAGGAAPTLIPGGASTGSPTGSSGFERGPDGIPKDTPHNRQLGGMLGANDPIVKMYGIPKESPATVAATTKARIEAELAADPAKNVSIHSVTDPITQQQSFISINKLTGEKKPLGGGGGGGGQAGPVPTFGDNQPHGDEFLKTLDPKTASAVKQLAEYKGVLPSGSALRSPYWQNLLTVLTPQYDPNFSAANYKTRSDTLSDFAKGKTSQNIQDLNTATGHLDRLAKSMASLNNSSFQPYNTVANAIGEKLGNPQITRAQLDAKASAGELAKIFKSSGATDPEIKSFEASVGNTSMAPAQQQAVIDEAVNLMRGRLAAIDDKWSRNMGIPPRTSVLTPQSQALFNKYAGGDNSGTQNAPQAPGAPTPSVDPYDLYLRGKK